MTRQRVATPAGPRPVPTRPKLHPDPDNDSHGGGNVSNSRSVSAGSSHSVCDPNVPTTTLAPRPGPVRTAAPTRVAAARTVPAPGRTSSRAAASSHATTASRATRVSARSTTAPRTAAGSVPVPRTAAGLGPLTALGVALLLGAGCVSGSLLDLLLVGGPAWALAVLYITTCAYTATRVRRMDWFSALVSPPLAFATAVILLAMLMPHAFGPGLLGVVATTFELLAAKAKALYLGTAISAAILFTRRTKARRAGLGRTAPGARLSAR